QHRPGLAPCGPRPHRRHRRRRRAALLLSCRRTVARPRSWRCPPCAPRPGPAAPRGRATPRQQHHPLPPARPRSATGGLHPRAVLPLRSSRFMSTLICGSLAFATISTFDGRFAQQILPDQLHILNVSFLVPTLKREFGGVAGNIAYSLHLLGGEPLVMATV